MGWGKTGTGTGTGTGTIGVMFDLSSSSEDLYQSEMDEVKLHCFCLTPWIDGSYFPSQAMSWLIVELNFPARHLERQNISLLIELLLLPVQQTV